MKRTLPPHKIALIGHYGPIVKEKKYVQVTDSGSSITGFSRPAGR